MQISIFHQRIPHSLERMGKGDFHLMYVRTKDGREVDFVITERETPLLLIKCKRTEKTLTPSLRYFKDRLQVQLAFQIIETPGYLKQVDRRTFVVGLDRLLMILP